MSKWRLSVIGRASVLAVFLLVFTHSANAEVLWDVSREAVSKYLKISTIESLAVGEAGYVDMWALCVSERGILKIRITAELQLKPSDYSAYAKVSRMPGNKFSIGLRPQLTGEGDNAKEINRAETLKLFVARLHEWPNCEAKELYYRRKLNHVPVHSMLGVNRLSDVLATETKPAVSIYPSNRNSGAVFKDCDDCPKMVVIPEGSFRMGNLSGHDNDEEKPMHTVNINYSFAVGKYEVTQRQWRSVMHDSPSRFIGDAKPVERVSWDDAHIYLKKLNAKLALTGRAERYRLLSESEWEYVARAQTETMYSFGDTLTNSQARFDVSSGVGTASVGSYPSNNFGLHDLHGNVAEWTEDCWNATYNGATVDGSSWASGNCSARILRGGSWSNVRRSVRSESRNKSSTNVRTSSNGFRIAKTLRR
jgi:formylglycine-generating enzyme required for sulfatase activity